MRTDHFRSETWAAIGGQCSLENLCVFLFSPHTLLKTSINQTHHKANALSPTNALPNNLIKLSINPQHHSENLGLAQ